jgi:ribonuclease D
MVADLKLYPILAIDTESNSLYAYREQVCLIQFSTGRTDYLVDPLYLRDLESLAPLFADPAIEKVFHAAEYDLICLKRDFHFDFVNIFDTMQAARILGRNAVGLGSMLESEFGLVLDKHFQRANWGLRPLPQPMMTYARLDTFYLVSLRNRLKADLETCGRWPLAAEDFLRLCSVNLPEIDNGAELCWRVSGGHDLTHQQMAVIQELCRYRDHQAQQADLPPFKVFSNDTLVSIAQSCPTSRADLAKIPGLPPRKLDRHAANLLQAVQIGMQAEPIKRQHIPRPEPDYLVRLDALRSWRKKVGENMGVESDVILPRDILDRIAEADPHTLLELSALMDGTPYRFEQYGEQILRTIARIKPFRHA